MAAHRKICSLDQLLDLRRRAREAGQTVVHCHGCFDVIHPGHIHHLQHARTLGDLLIVSVSSDDNVNKGVNRPLIPDDLRASSLAALECVDAVYLNHFPTAVELLEQLQPDVFVKGREYETSVDPRFLAERDAVQKFGGEVFFSSGDVVYSSTALIGALRDTSAFNDEKVQRYCRSYDVTPQNVQRMLGKARGQKIVVIGDYILDRYHFCEATGIAGEGPMMALRTLQAREYDGGAAVIARHVAAMGASPVLVTALTRDAASRQVEMRLRSEGVETISTNHRKQLVEKNRFIVDDQKLFKVDQGSVTSLDSRRMKQVADQILAACDGAAGVIFADFGYGLITPGLLDRILPEIRRKVGVITADVSGKQSNLLRFKGVDMVCPTEREIRETLQDFSSGMGAIVSQLLRTTGTRSAIVTLGKQGLVACEWAKQNWEDSNGRLSSEYLPTLGDRAVDPLGCGDALLAAASVVLAAGASLQVASFIGSLAAACELQQLGNMPISSDAILDAMVRRPAYALESKGLVA